MTKQIDFSRISKDELLNLLRAQAQQVIGLQTGGEVLKVEIEKGWQPAVNIPNSIEPAEGIPDPGSKHDIGQPLPGQIANIKPGWRTKNRLQNCHQPKQK